MSQLTMPTLRERRDDIPLLANYFARLQELRADTLAITGDIETATMCRYYSVLRVDGILRSERIRHVRTSD